MPTSTVENYVKRLYQEQREGEMIAMGRLATLMQVVPGTATAMVKTLADSGLVQYSPRAGVQLTEAGNHLALHVLRRHRLVELFLVRIVGLDWSEVHAEAEELEHVISEKLLERIDALLGHPTADPHGDPIPSPSGEVASADGKSLANCALDERVEITRVIDQQPRFLQFVEQCGLIPGQRVRVTQRNEQADAMTLEVAKKSGNEITTLSTAAASKFAVKAV